MRRYLNQHEVCSTYHALSNNVHELLLGSSPYQANSDICSESKLQKPHSVPPSDKLAINSTTTMKNPSSVPSGCTLRSTIPRLVSGAVGEGGHHVPSALRHCPAVLLPRALESALSPGAVCVSVKGEHLLQVLKHLIEESSTEGPLLKLPPVSVHSLLMGLEAAVEVSLLVGLILGVKVVMVMLMLTKMVKVFEDVIKVKGMVVLVEVVIANSSSWSMALPR